MITIAICDDIKAEIDIIRQFIEGYGKEKNISFEMAIFTHPDELLSACEKRTFSIYILDIVMPMLNGIDVGTEIRRSNRECQIIYFTSAPEFALDAYAAKPADFLVKPVARDKVYQALDYVIPKVISEENANMTIKIKTGIVTIPLKNVIYCENFNRKVVLHMLSGETIESSTIRIGFIEYIKDLMEEKSMLQIHSSYVCNMNYVDRLSDKEALLRNGEVLPVSKKMYPSVRQVYINYKLG